MIYLLISILCTCGIYIIFKMFDKYNVDVAPGVSINYLTCSLFSLVFAERTFTEYFSSSPNNLLFFAAILGLSYVTTFTLMGRTTILLGVGGGTIVSRMSMVIPASFAFFYLGENISFLKVAGILLALLAIYFTVSKTKNAPAKNINFNYILIPVLAFFGVGIVDVMLKLSQLWFFGNKMDTNFIALSYFAACLGSFIILSTDKKVGFKHLFIGRNLLLGGLLGTVNYFGIYFFYKALTTPNLQASTIFPLNSVGIVAISTLIAIIFMGEKINLRKTIGLALAIAAIMLISYE